MVVLVWCRLEEVNVVDMKFLYGCSKPTVAVLYTDQRSARHIKTYSIAGTMLHTRPQRLW